MSEDTRSEALELIEKQSPLAWEKWRYSQDHLRRHAVIDLAGANLSAFDLSDFDFSYVNFVGAQFHKTKLNNASLFKANLNKASFRNADMNGIDLREAQYKGTDFTGAMLYGMRVETNFFVYIDESKLAFRNAAENGITTLQLRFLELLNAKRERSGPAANPEHIQRVRNSNSDWNLWVHQKTEADAFFYPELSTALEEHDLKKRTLIFSDFRNASLRGADFTDSALSYADLSGADLRNTNLNNAELTGTKLIGANLTGANLPPTPLDDVLIKNARFDDPENKHAPDSKSSRVEFDLLAEEQKDLMANKYGSMLGDNDNPEEIIRDLISLLASGQKVREEIEGKIEAAGAAIRQFDGLFEFMNATKEEIKNFNASIKEVTKAAADKASSDAISGIDDKVTAAIKAVQDNFVFKDAKADWDKKSKTHWWLFAGATVLFIAAVIGLIISSFVYHEDIMKLIPINQDGSFPIGSFIMITVPIAAIAWVLKMFSRFALQNLTLAHDATQRRIIFDTYIKLVQETAPNMSNEDRAIMLAAIFRPLPGAHQADIAPPSLLDLIGAKDITSVGK